MVLALRYDADLRTLALIATYFSLLAYAWFFHMPLLINNTSTLTDTTFGSTDSSDLSSARHFLLTAVTATLAKVDMLALIHNILLFLALCLFSFVCATITHNTMHCQMFKIPILNKMIQVVLSLGYGHPVSSYVPGHNLSHHKFTQLRKDAMRTTKLRYKWNLFNGLMFQPTVVSAVFRSDMRYLSLQRLLDRPFYRQALRELWVVVLYKFILAYLDFSTFLVYVHLPHAFAQWGIVSINMLQHDGCYVLKSTNGYPLLKKAMKAIDEEIEKSDHPDSMKAPKMNIEQDSDMTAENRALNFGVDGLSNAIKPENDSSSSPSAAGGLGAQSFSANDACKLAWPEDLLHHNVSRNFTGSIINFLTCNNGYHSIHHVRPYTHWSLLKAAHEKEVRPFMHPALDQPNILSYIFKSFIYPGKRLWYDGRPLDIDELIKEFPSESDASEIAMDNKDEDWLLWPTDDPALQAAEKRHASRPWSSFLASFFSDAWLNTKYDTERVTARSVAREKIDNVPDDDRNMLQKARDTVLLVAAKIVSPTYSPFFKID